MSYPHVLHCQQCNLSLLSRSPPSTFHPLISTPPNVQRQRLTKDKEPMLALMGNDVMLQFRRRVSEV